MQFECTSERVGDTVVVKPVGEIDRDTVSVFREAMLTAVAGAGTGRVEIDLTEVDFLDSSGVGALLLAHRGAVTAGATLVVRNPVEPVRTVLEITRVADLLGL